MPASALDNPFAKQQKVLLYLMPLFFAISGINFPIGVLIYWLTTNVWSMCQQFYVIRRMPAPGSAAEKALSSARAEAQGQADAGARPSRAWTEPSGRSSEDAPSPAGQRQQPKRQEAQGRPPAAERRPSTAAETKPTAQRRQLT